jgi:hypothetical protein
MAFLFLGCAYHGNLKNDFKPITNQNTKLPVKACLVFDSNLEKFHYKTDAYVWYTVDVAGQPGLNQAIVNTFDSLFEEVSLTSGIDEKKFSSTDIIIFPSIEKRNNVLYMSMLVKKSDTDEEIQKYESSSDIDWNIPAEVHILGFINSFRVIHRLCRWTHGV